VSTRHFENRGCSSSEQRKREPPSSNSGATPAARQNLDFLRARSQTVAVSNRQVREEARQRRFVVEADIPDGIGTVPMRD
jgi:hypothetical protein